MLSKFNFIFTWEYGGDGKLQSLLHGIVRVLDDDDERSLEQIVIGCVHQASPGLTLIQPNNDLNVPYEMKFTVHPPHESFCIKKIVLLSESRNLELFVNGGYEKSTRGIMLTLNNQRKSSLFEAQFDLSGFTETKSNATIKFLSHPCKDHMKLQAVVLKVEQCKPISFIPEDQPGGAVNLSSVRRYLGSVGRPLSSDAQKMLQSIENYQKSPAFKAQQMLSSQAALLQNIARTNGTRSSRGSQISQDEEKVVSNEKPEKCKPEEDLPFMNMLSELGLKDKPISNAEKSPATDITSSPQTRWSAYLQSRIRAGASPEAPRSMSLDGYPSVNADTRGKRTKQRPLSVGCVNELEQSFNPEQLREKWLKEGSHSQRCETCGCPGCISVFNSISTSIFAAEKRILEKVDKTYTQLQDDINSKFQLLYQLLDAQQVIKDRGK